MKNRPPDLFLTCFSNESAPSRRHPFMNEDEKGSCRGNIDRIHFRPRTVLLPPAPGCFRVLCHMLNSTSHPSSTPSRCLSPHQKNPRRIQPIQEERGGRGAGSKEEVGIRFTTDVAIHINGRLLKRRAPAHAPFFRCV